MKKNTGLEYEKLTQLVFEQIINSKEINNIEVRHDVTLQGISTTHQIDVYWEFEYEGIKYINIVQAKEWKSRVPQKEMLALKGILADLPFKANGIFVTLSGYQKGAIDVAENNGISIYELRPLKENDLEGYIKNIHIDFDFMTPVYKNVSMIIDGDYLIKNNINKDEILKGYYMNGMDKLYDKNKAEVTTVSDLIISLCRKAEDKTEYIEHLFNEDTFIAINDTMIKLKGISGEFGMEHNKRRETLMIENVVGLILKDISTGKFQTFDKNNVLRK